MDKIEFFNTAISSEALPRIADVLSSTFLSEGKLVAEFEAGIENKLGIINPVALNSGTAALHLALVVANIGPGDEVIIPSQTFIATGLVVLMVGAVPVFADIVYETGNIDPNDVIKKITSKTKAIIPVHWGGYPCDMDELIAIASNANILIIEDAAHAIGASYKNQSIGGISDMTCFSFQAIKHLTTGDGGALACRSKQHFQRAMTLRWFGIDRQNDHVGQLGEREYNLKEVGFKYHLNNYAAALGLANLEELEKNISRRKEIAAIYDLELRNIPGLRHLEYKNDRQSSYWLYGLHVERRMDFVGKLNEKGIPVSVVHVGIHKNDLFTDSSVHTLQVQKQFDSSQIHIPMHNALGDDDIAYIVGTIKSGW